MAERLQDIEARIGSVKQLSAVVGAMRGIAAARSREANEQLPGIRAYAGTIGVAIAQALALLPGQRTPAATGTTTGRHIVIALCAEQGFAGSFDTPVLDAAQRLITASGGDCSDLLLVGDRGLMKAGERDMTPGWSIPMAAHASQVAATANRLAGEVYNRLDGTGVARATIVHALPGSQEPLAIAEMELIPFDLTRFPPSNHAMQPLINIAPQALVSQLAEEYVFAELCEALMLSFAAENDARMRAMIAARTNVANKLEILTESARRIRQEEITNEVIELAAGTR